MHILCSLRWAPGASDGSKTMGTWKVGVRQESSACTALMALQKLQILQLSLGGVGVEW